LKMEQRKLRTREREVSGVGGLTPNKMTIRTTITIDAVTSSAVTQQLSERNEG
jgi:hypothetical protein